MRADAGLLRALLLGSASVLTVAMIQGCGASPTRQLVSVTISPSSAQAKGYPNGEVPFVATGHYNTDPMTVTPLQATWGASVYPAKIATVTQSGLATCTQGISGTTVVEAWVAAPPGTPVCNTIDSAGRPCGAIGAAANLTCP
jgi:hypothetical protein